MCTASRMLFFPDRRFVSSLALVGASLLALPACNDGDTAPVPSGEPESAANPGTPGPDPSAAPTTRPPGGPDVPPGNPGAPATKAGRLDAVCALSGIGTGAHLLVDPTGKRVVYPRLSPSTNGLTRPGEIVMRDLATNTVKVLASIGDCYRTGWVGGGSLTAPPWTVSFGSPWMRATPFGILLTDYPGVEGGLHLFDWNGLELARIAPNGHRWLPNEVEAVSANATGIRAAFAAKVGATASIVTYTSASTTGAATSVTSAPFTILGGDIDTAVSADGSGVGAILVGHGTVYTMPTTAGATPHATTMPGGSPFAGPSFRQGRTATGALLRANGSFADELAKLYAVDFTSGEVTLLTHSPSGVVSTTPRGTSFLFTELTVSSSAVTKAETWSFTPGAAPVSLASTVPTNIRTPAQGSTVDGRLSHDGSQFVLSLEDQSYRPVVYALDLASSSFRAPRSAVSWALGGNAMLVTVEATGLRFEDLTTAAPAKVVTITGDPYTYTVDAASPDGHVALVDTHVFDDVAKRFQTTPLLMTDAGARRGALPATDGSVHQAAGAWTDGVIAMVADGIYFFR